jgi:hypothetical protein
VAFAKDYPLDGQRGTVEKWLQYSFSATPDAGQETWNASEAADNTYLVEYHFVPNVKGAPDIDFMFTADLQHGYLIGKNRDARDLLGGGGPRASGAAPAKRRSSRRSRPKPAAPAPDEAAPAAPPAEEAAPAPPLESPQEVPLLPLPSESAAPARAEGPGDFGSDTVKPEPESDSEAP